jgi:UDP-N-acetylmuramyl tripeptide synthase
VAFLAVWLGKAVLTGLRLAGRSGNALPGLVVEKLFPAFLPSALARLPHGVVVVSGTNGKTTTTKMLATALAQKFTVLTNDTGSNFVRGTITAAVDAADWRGRLRADVAVFELDEAHAVRFVEVFAPQRVLLLNVMRDQLDRFGEIDTTAALLRKVASTATVAVGLNRDDPRIAAIAADVAAEVVWFGVAPHLRQLFPTDEELYRGVRPSPKQAEAAAERGPAVQAQLREWGPDGATLALSTGDAEADPDAAVQTLALRAGGAHNAQNAAAAAAMAGTFDLAPDLVFAGLRDVEPAFGRGQSFRIAGRTVSLHLVKNPAGFRQSLRAVQAESPDQVLIAINDDYADGRDVSWLWDVHFAEHLQAVQQPESGEQPGQGDPGVASAPVVRTSGTRAADMAVRLRYDDVPVGGVDPVLHRAVDHAVAAAPAGGAVLVFATYTAMWALHEHLAGLSAPSERTPASGSEGS